MNDTLSRPWRRPFNTRHSLSSLVVWIPRRDLYKRHSLSIVACVFITAGHIIKLWEGGGGHTNSREKHHLVEIYHSVGGSGHGPLKVFASTDLSPFGCWNFGIGQFLTAKSCADALACALIFWTLEW